MPRHSEATLAAIKQAVDIVALVGEYLPVTRAGSKFKALCPFHDDHNPSLELNPDRQSYKCWSCGAGGDVFDFVKEYERVEFPEALRMLAERAGVALEAPSPAGPEPRGPSKSELMAVNAWAEGAFREALAGSKEAREYLGSRGISGESVERFKLGYAPGTRGWLVPRAKRAGFPVELLEKAGLVTRPADSPGEVRGRFRGRLVFPIHDLRGRAIGFGGRVLPEVEQYLAASGKRVAKYLNSPETPIFQKRRVLYASDLARGEAREAGWVAVVEGYTDVIAAHQVGLRNVVGTLGTALSDDHVEALRRMGERVRVVLIFDGDAAGQNAADRSLELFLGHEVDVRVLTLPDGLDPCDFLLLEGADAFRALVAKAVDPLAFALGRAEVRFDLEGAEGARRAAEWVLGIFGKVPPSNRIGMDVKIDKAIVGLAQKLGVPINTLRRRLSQIRRENRAKRFAPGRPFEESSPRTAPQPSGPGEGPAVEGVGDAPDGTPALRARATDRVKPVPTSIRLSGLNAIDRELVRLLLTEPKLVARVITRVAVDSVRDLPLRQILQACYDLYSEGSDPSFDLVALRLEDPGVRSLAAGLLLPYNDPGAFPEDDQLPPIEVRLIRVLAMLARREHSELLREIQAAKQEAVEANDQSAYRALQTEYLRLMNQRPDTNTKSAS